MEILLYQSPLKVIDITTAQTDKRTAAYDTFN